MTGFRFSRELDTTDLLKSVVAIAGAILAFFLVTNIQLQNESTRLKLELTKQIPTLQPFVQTYYSNRVDPNDPATIEIKLYLKILSEHYLYFFPPKISVVKTGSQTDPPEPHPSQLQLTGVSAYEGLFSPGTEYFINYSVTLEDRATLDGYDVLLSFDIETDNKIQEAYTQVLAGLDGDTKALIDVISYKTHTYREAVYLENPEFEDFFENAGRP